MKKKADRDVDLLIVGAGPAGSAAALAAARRGARVLIVERRKVIGSPVRCGEYVPRGLAGELPLGAFTSVQPAPALVVHLPSGAERRVEAVGNIVDRGALDRALADAAVDAGSELWRSAPLEHLERTGRATLGGLREGTTLRAKLVIGADGPKSAVATAAGLGHPKVMLGLQREVRLERPLELAHLYFWHTCRYGYGWLFPKGDQANLGVAVPRGEGRAARGALAELTRRLVAKRWVPATSEPRRGDPGRSGLIPCSGPLPRLAAGRVLLVGDAAGQTDALTGAGIVAAVRAGTLAGVAAAKALASGRPRSAAVAYEARWRAALGRQAARTLERRFELEALWDRNTERAVATAWLGNDNEGRHGRDEEST